MVAGTGVDEGALTAWEQAQEERDVSLSGLVEGWQREYSGAYHRALSHALARFFQVSKNDLLTMTVEELHPKIDAWGAAYHSAIISKEYTLQRVDHHISALISLVEYGKSYFMHSDVAEALEAQLVAWKKKNALYMPQDILSRPDADFLTDWNAEYLSPLYRGTLDTYLEFAPSDLRTAGIQDHLESFEKWARKYIIDVSNPGDFESGKNLASPSSLQSRLSAISSVVAFGRVRQYISQEVAASFADTITLWKEGVTQRELRDFRTSVPEGPDADFLVALYREGLPSASKTAVTSFMGSFPENLTTMSSADLRERTTAWIEAVSVRALKKNIKTVTVILLIDRLLAMFSFGEREGFLSSEVVGASCKLLRERLQLLEDHHKRAQKEQPLPGIIQGRADAPLLSGWFAEKIANDSSRVTLGIILDSLRTFFPYVPVDLSASKEPRDLRKGISNWSTELLRAVVSGDRGGESILIGMSHIKSLFAYAREHGYMPSEIANAAISSVLEGRERLRLQSVMQQSIPMFISQRNDRHLLEGWLADKSGSLSPAHSALARFLSVAPSDLTTISVDEACDSIKNFSATLLCTVLEKGGKPQSVNIVIGLISSVFAYGVRQKIISQDVGNAVREVMKTNVRKNLEIGANDIPETLSHRADADFIVPFYQKSVRKNAQHAISALNEFLKETSGDLTKMGHKELREDIESWTKKLFNRFSSNELSFTSSHQQVLGMRRLFRYGAERGILSSDLAETACDALTSAADHLKYQQIVCNFPSSISERPDAAFVTSWYKEHMKNEIDILALYHFLDTAPKNLTAVNAQEIRGSVDRWTVKVGSLIKRGTLSSSNGERALVAMESFFEHGAALDVLSFEVLAAAKSALAPRQKVPVRANTRSQERPPRKISQGM